MERELVLVAKIVLESKSSSSFLKASCFRVLSSVMASIRISVFGVKASRVLKRFFKLLNLFFFANDL